VKSDVAESKPGSWQMGASFEVAVPSEESLASEVALGVALGVASDDSSEEVASEDSSE
jgi:hypothetical protein